MTDSNHTSFFYFFKMLYNSSGILRYYNDPLLKLIVEVDSEIVLYYKRLIPQYYRINPQLYSSHISVIRKIIPPKMEYWNKYDGQVINFVYSPITYVDERYYWLNAYSVQLDNIRSELGLIPNIYRPEQLLPNYKNIYHITLGNKK